MRFRPRAFREEPEINFIPLIDVLLVILIFLMVSTTYSRYAELKINLPTGESTPPPQRLDQVDIGVDAQGNYSIDRKSVTVNGPGPLSEEIKKVAGGLKDPVIVISADARTPHQAVITVMEAAQRAGLGKITFTTQAAQK